MDRDGGELANVDIGVLGKTMLDAARAARIGVTITLLNPARNVYVSAAAAEILGWPAEELIALDPMAIVAPEDTPRLRDRLDRRARGEQGQASYELAVLRKD